ncbi:MAG: 4Fe-4S binding protein [Candidatus Zixiibacteriota bacterium]
MNTGKISQFILVIFLVVILSALSVKLWGEKPETVEVIELTIPSVDITPARLARDNHLPLKPVLAALKIDSARAETASLAELNLTSEQVKSVIGKKMVLFQEEQSKNWQKILIKFTLWILVLTVPLILLTQKKLTPKRRKILYAVGILTFGVVLGSDPSPMGTVKDAVFLLTAHQTVFVPRLIALGIFLLIVVIANKFICSWGCQFGVLQDFLFRLNRKKHDFRGLTRQYKPPFWLSNSIRIAVFLALAAAGFFWTFDIIGQVDPFKVYNPAVLGIIGGTFILLILIAALFIYRPWCHFFCPFGLVAWLFEKMSLFRIKVDYRKCDACQACARACPSNVMDAILKNDRVKPDCFACGNCIEACPTDAVSFTASREKTGEYANALDLREQKRRARAERGKNN